MTQQTRQPEGLLRLRDVMRMIGISRAEVYRRVRRPASAGGGLPAPVKLGRMSAWPESEILAWIEAQKARRAPASS